MPDSPRRTAACRTRAAGDNISQYLTSSYEVNCKHLQFIKPMCSGILLGIQPFSPGSSANQPTSSCNICSWLGFSYWNCWRLQILPGQMISELWEQAVLQVKRQRTICESIRQREALFPYCTRNWVTHVPQMSPPTARRNCRWEISLGPSEYL